MIFKQDGPFENKTWVFLKPCLRSHGEEFLSYYKYIKHYAVGIHNSFLDDTPYVKRRCIHLLCDPTVNTPYFMDFLHFVKTQKYFIGDHSAPIQNPTEVWEGHMIILEIPEEHIIDYEFFLRGKYSKMYTKDFREEHFEKVGRYKALSVMEKDPKKKELFRMNLNKIFSSQIKEEDIKKDWEHELPLSRHQEIFNCKGDRVFLNVELDLKKDGNSNK